MILQPLIDFYQRDGDMSPYGYERHDYHYAITLDLSGNVVSLDDITVDGKAISLDVPRWDPSRTSALLPSCLTDPAHWVLALDGGKRWAVWQPYNIEILSGATDPRVVAVRTWMENWTPEAAASLCEGLEITKAHNIAIMVGQEFAHDIPEARALWDRALADSIVEDGFCYVTGERAPLTKAHASVRIGGDGSKIVSAKPEQSALHHWGLTGLQTAPISDKAAHAYATALKTLDYRGQRRTVSGLAVTYWTEAEGIAGRAFADELAACFGADEVESVPSAEAETKALADAIEAIRNGHVPSGASPEATFHVLAIKPGKGRHVVQWAHTGTLGEFAEHVHQHAADLGTRRPPALWQLLGSALRPGEKQKDLPPSLSLDLIKAALTGAQYPSALAIRVLNRLRVGEDIAWQRAAILRGWLARNHHLTGDNMTHTAPYRLGRVLRLAEAMQQAANPNVSVTIRERLWGVLSTRPHSAVARIAEATRHYKPALRRDGKGGLAEWFDNQIGEALGGMSDLPRSMSDSDRAQMALGYWDARIKAGEASTETVTATQEG